MGPSIPISLIHPCSTTSLTLNFNFNGQDPTPVHPYTLWVFSYILVRFGSEPGHFPWSARLQQTCGIVQHRQAVSSHNNHDNFGLFSYESLIDLFLFLKDIYQTPSIFHRFTGVGLAENTGFTGLDIFSFLLS